MPSVSERSALSGPLARAMRRSQGAYERTTRVLALAIGAATLAFGALIVGDFIAQMRWLSPPVAIAQFCLIIGLPIVLGALAFVLPMRALRWIAFTVAIAFLATLGTWAISGPVQVIGAGAAWPISITAIPVVCFILWRPDEWAWLYLLATSLGTYFVHDRVSTSPHAHIEALEGALFSTVFVAVFAACSLVGLRNSRRLDEAEAAVVEAAALAAARAARERERARFEAIIHDGAISTLLAAGRSTLDPRVGAEQASAALAALDDARGTDVTVTAHSMAHDLRTLVSDMTRGLARSGYTVVVAVTEELAADPSIPAPAAEAIVAATAEALRNSFRHAGNGVRRVLSVRATEEAVSVGLRDDGVGFDPAAVPAGRLGISGSIIGRMATVDGGRARVHSVPGRGTEVVLSWAVHPAAPEPPPLAERAASWPEQTSRPSVRIDVSSMLKLESVAARVITLSFAMVQGVLAFVLPDPRATVLVTAISYAAFLVATWLVTRPSTDPLPMPWTISVSAAVVVCVAVGATQLSPVGTGQYSSWFLGAVSVVLLVLVLRGRGGWAWTAYAVMVAIMLVWTLVVGASPLMALQLTIRHAATLLVGSLFALGLGSTASALRRSADARLQQDVADAAAREAERERAAQLARVDRLAGPLLRRIAAGDELSDEERAECLLVEASLRDRVRGGVLASDGVEHAARLARQRGVHVSLLDDSTGDPLPAAVYELVIAELDGLTGGSIVARAQPAGRDSVASVVVEPEGADPYLRRVLPDGSVD